MRKRERRHSFGLPDRVYPFVWKDGKTVTYRFIPPSGKSVNLGTDKNAAILAYGRLMSDGEHVGAIKTLWDLYKMSPYWARLSDTTKDDYEQCSKKFLPVFGHVHVAAITPADIARYLREERSEAPVRANREVSVISSIMSLAIENGLINANPCRDIKRNYEEPVSHVPQSDTLNKFAAWLQNESPQRRIIGMAAEYSSLTGSRQVEFLQLQWDQVEDTVIRLKRGKQRKAKRNKIVDVIQITPHLRALLDRLKAACSDSLYVFPNRYKHHYTAAGFKTMWSRCREKAITDGIITPEEKFTFHQLRAYYVTRFKSDSGLLPDIHANPATTASIYDRNKEVPRSAL